MDPVTAQDAPANPVIAGRVPLWLKCLYTAFVAVLVPVMF